MTSSSPGHACHDRLRLRAAVAVALSVLALSGCSTVKSSGAQLERVAKDWALSIRASQVIPVYPLTEDLQPGDVFLVQTPVEEQTRIYMDKGFLPLGNLIVRLPVRGYDEFYAGWPDVADGDSAPPRLWQFPASGESDFSRAPIAAFPTYNFSVSRSTGLSLAIPVQSVPLGLNLLDSASADGSITLKDAHTYALPTRLLWDTTQAWAQANQTYLQQYEPLPATKSQPASEFFLRVVHRVYLVKTVNVSLFSNRASGADASAGIAPEVKLLNLSGTTEAAKRFDEVNKVLAAASDPEGGAQDTGIVAPIKTGGRVRLAMATARDVSLVETFARPLVIGYLATDYPILSGGRLGAPVSTFARLEQQKTSTAKPIPYTGCDANCGRLRGWLKVPQNRKSLADWLDRQPTPMAIADLLTGDFGDLRARAVRELNVP